MAEYSAPSGRPRLGITYRTRTPYVIFPDVRSDGDYVINLRYLSLNKGTNAAGDTEVLNFTSRNEIPILDERYHRLVMLCAGKMIAGELAPLTDSDGSIRYPGMDKALTYFTAEYEAQLAKDKEEASYRSIARTDVAFRLGGAEYAFNYRY